MGASILWRPLEHGTSLPVNAPSSFMDALDDASGSRGWPLTLHREDIPALRGLRAGLKHEAAAIDKLIEALDTHGSVELFARW